MIQSEWHTLSAPNAGFGTYPHRNQCLSTNTSRAAPQHDFAMNLTHGPVLCLRPTRGNEIAMYLATMRSHHSRLRMADELGMPELVT